MWARFSKITFKEFSKPCYKNFTVKYQNILEKMISKLVLANTHWLRPNNDLLNMPKWSRNVANSKNI